MTVATGKEQILIITAEAQVRFLLERVMDSTGISHVSCANQEEMDSFLEIGQPILGIFSESLPGISGIEMAARATARIPGMPVILFAETDSPETLRQAMAAGVTEILRLPLRVDEVVDAVQKGLEKANRRQKWVRREARMAASSLSRQLDELTTLVEIGQTVTSTFDLDEIFSKLVDAAVMFTGAEEGSLLLLDDQTGELYMRAARNFQDEFVRTFRIKVEDSLVSSVLKNGEPYLLDEKDPKKIKTAYFVHSLIYVPIKAKGKTLGVLGVDNRQKRFEFKEHEVKLLVMLADYAAIALENAGQYNNTLQERNKLDTVVAKIQDGVIVVDNNQHLLLVNPMARAILNMEEIDWSGRPLIEAIPDPKIIEMLQNPDSEAVNPCEIFLENDRVFRATTAEITGVGTAITLSDITHFKQIDRIKSDFVNTVSHDLRSPLMAILGYMELFEQVGSVNEMQHEFIQRMVASVQKITRLIDDLLNLGRIEAGIEVQRELLDFRKLVEEAVDGYKHQADAKQVNLTCQKIQGNLPRLFASEVQIRRVVNNLIENAVKYTPQGGKVNVSIVHKHGQLILRVSDTGAGIPALELPNVFDKFFTASNANPAARGTGLGLAIVKSIVESHQGRVRVDSNLGQGATFTVMLPVEE